MAFSTAISASAATTSKLPSLSSSKYIRCYTLASSGKVYAYTSSSLTTKKSGYWIDCSTDECYIVAVSGNAVKVSYPIGNGKRSTQWFRRSDFTATNISGSLTTKTITANITSYTRPGGSSYGYAGKGDSIYVLGTSGNYTQIIYELSSGLWKMGWVKTATLNQSTKTTTTTTNTSKTTTTNKTTTTTTTNTTTTKTTTASTSSSTSYKSQTVEVDYAGKVVDTFMGVKCLYTNESYTSYDTTYCCAAYVKRFYSSVYGLSVYNLTSGQTPKVDNTSFTRTTSPKPGDICYFTSGGSGHWSIVKAVNEDGSTVIIEQNRLWTDSSGKLVTGINRHVDSSFPNLKYFTWTSK
jgi:surface antigen